MTYDVKCPCCKTWHEFTFVSKKNTQKVIKFCDRCRERFTFELVLEATLYVHDVKPKPYIKDELKYRNFKG